MTDNAIKAGINCNSKNLEALENLTLDIDQKERNLNSKIDGVEEKLVDDMNCTVKGIKTTISQSNKNHDRDKRKLQELI